MISEKIKTNKGGLSGIIRNKAIPVIRKLHAEISYKRRFSARMPKTQGNRDRTSPIASAATIFICAIRIEKIRYGNKPKAGFEKIRFIKFDDRYIVRLLLLMQN